MKPNPALLTRLSLIVAVVAALAVAGVNFVLVKNKVARLRSDLGEQAVARQKAELNLADAKENLKATTTALVQTRRTLQAATAEKEKALAQAMAQTKRAEALTQDLAKRRRERDEAQAELAAYKSTGFTSRQVVEASRQIKGLQDALVSAQQERQVLQRKIMAFGVDDRCRWPEDVVMPAEIKGKVLAYDPKWHFVVLNVGEDQGVLEHGDLLVSRGGGLITKVRVSKVQKDSCVANILPGWELGDVAEGDLAIPAAPSRS